MKLSVRQPETPSEWESYFDLRYRILRKPWNQPLGSERNEGDTNALHYACFSENTIIAVGRLDRVDEQCCQLRFFAVENNLQGKGIGKTLMNHIEKSAFQLGYKSMMLHARENAIAFYEKLGFQIVAPSHTLFGVIKHVEMQKSLQ